MRCLSTTLTLALALALFAVAAGAAGRGAKPRTGDRFWAAPGFAGSSLRSIAMLPAASYDRNLESENAASGLFGQSLKDAGYRWISATTTRTLLQAQLGDSAVKALQQDVIDHGRCDSLTARRVAAALRTSALLSVRVDRWDRMDIQWNQAGRPSTTVQITAALVDSTGRLLWSGAGSETAEGPYHDPSANPIGVSGSDLENKPVTGQGGPPAYAEVLTRLFARWAPQFPQATAAADTTH
jgi:hypothetical protein